MIYDIDIYNGKKIETFFSFDKINQNSPYDLKHVHPNFMTINLFIDLTILNLVVG